MVDFNPDRLSRIVDSDPALDREEFDSFMDSNFGEDTSVSSNSAEHVVEMGGEEETQELSSKVFDIKGVRSRPGMGDATLGRENMRNRPNEDGEYEVYRGDPIPMKTYKKMSADPEIAFGLYLLRSWVGGLPYTIDCSDSMVKGVVEHVLDDIWKDLVRDMLDAIRLGFSFGEKVWERDEVIIVSEDQEGEEEVIYEGKIASLDKIKFLDPTHYFKFYKKKDEISRVEQQLNKGSVSVDRDKLVWFTLDQEYSSVFGRPRFKNIYSEWYYSNVNIKYMLNDLQKRGSPHIEVEFPPGKTRIDGEMVDNGEIAMNMAKQLTSDGVVAIPSSTDDSGNRKWSVSYANTKQNESESPFLEFLQHSGRRKMKGLGIPPSVASADSNFSNADAGGDMLVVVVEDMVNQLEDCIQKDVIDDIVEHNFGPKKTSLVDLKIDKSALGRRSIMKEILKNMIRTGSSMEGHSLKSWPDPKAMMNELGITPGSFGDVFSKIKGTDRPEGETPIDEAEDDEESNDTDTRRDPDDNNRDRERDSSDENITEE